MEDVSDKLQIEISKLVKRVSETTGYQELESRIKDGGVRIYHPSGIFICYATINKNEQTLDHEIYQPGYEEAIKKEETEALELLEAMEKGELENETDDTLERKRKADRKIKVKRTKKKKYIEVILVSLASLVLLSASIKKGTEIYKSMKENKVVAEYIGSDTNITAQNTSRTNNNKYVQYDNVNIASEIKETGKNPWPLLTDVIQDMSYNKIDNFKTVVNSLHTMGYFEYDYETLVITANARKADGGCDFKKLIAYMRERAIFAISQEQLKTMSLEEKENIANFLVAFDAKLAELNEPVAQEKKGIGL